MFKMSAETKFNIHFEIFFLFFPENKNPFFGGGGGGGNINLSLPAELAQRVKKVKAH